MRVRIYRLAALVSIIGIVLAGLPTPAPDHVTAQSSLKAWTRYALTVYSSSSRSSSIVGVLAPKADLILESRNADTRWVLGHTLDGSVRGWMETRFLGYESESMIVSLLVSNEEMFVARTTSLNATYANIRLDASPVIPRDLGRARTLFELGQIRGANPHVVSKIGDCITDNDKFLVPFSGTKYNLGQYTQLQPVIDQFADSLGYDSLAAYDGLVTTAVLDPLFANPDVCLPGESPLQCEFRVRKPSVAIIMFGAQDLLFTPAVDFDRNLRRIVHETTQAGVIPIVSTFPGNLELWKLSIQYNKIVVQVAADYDVPLLNLWQALEMLPNHGLATDERHLSQPITSAGDLSGSNLKRGYPARNLVTLQVLDVVWRSTMY
ncbi:MAG: SGNH/GDSL hydrolase family protein [Anaerolineae bacterium]|nr:SGNH/GDSL hydrolase family protein [Anaerolineae bacterium]